MNHSEWYNRYNFDDNQESTEKLLKFYGIDKYNFIPDGYGSTALLITYCCKRYKVEIDKDNKVAYIYRGVRRNRKDYFRLCKTFKYDILYNTIKLMLNDNKVVDKSDIVCYNSTIKEEVNYD